MYVISVVSWSWTTSESSTTTLLRARNVNASSATPDNLESPELLRPPSCGGCFRCDIYKSIPKKVTFSLKPFINTAEEWHGKCHTFLSMFFIYYLKPTCTQSRSEVTSGRGRRDVGWTKTPSTFARALKIAVRCTKKKKKRKKAWEAVTFLIKGWQTSKEIKVWCRKCFQEAETFDNVFYFSVFGWWWWGRGGDVWQVGVKLALAWSSHINIAFACIKQSAKVPLPWLSVSLPKGFQRSSSHPENPHTTAVIMIKLLSNAWLDPRARQHRASLSLRCQVQLGEGIRDATADREKKLI